MNIKSKKGLLAAGGTLLAGIAVTIGVLLGGQGETPSRSVYPIGTNTPAGYRPGIVLVRNLFSGAGVTVTPAPGQVGTHIEIYWDDVQATAGGALNWDPVLTRVAYADSLGLDSWLGLQFYQNNNAGQDLLNLPAGVATVTYTGSGSGCVTEIAPDYGAPGFINPYATAVASMMTTFGSDARVAGFAIQMGASGETQIAQEETNCKKRAALELQVSCAEYIAAVKAAMVYHRAGTDKPITLATHLAACANSAYDADRKVAKAFMEYSYWPTPTPGAAPPGATATPTPLWIGYRNNGLNAGTSRNWMYNQVDGWGRMQIGYVRPDLGGVYFEPGSPFGYPASVPTAEVVSHAAFMLYNAASANADNVFLQKEWYPYEPADVLYAITTTLGMTRADSPAFWIVFRGAESQMLNAGTGYEYSDVPDAYTKLASLVGATPTPVCQPSIRATAVSFGGVAPPPACLETITVSDWRSRNALRYATGTTIGIDVDDLWFRGGAADGTYAVKLDYLSQGSGTLTLAWKNLAGVEDTEVIAVGATGAWAQASFSMVDAALNNQYNGTHDLQLRVTGAAVTLHRLFVEYGSGGGGSPPATFTPTPTITGTPYTATPTATPTATGTALSGTCGQVYRRSQGWVYLPGMSLTSCEDPLLLRGG